MLKKIHNWLIKKLEYNGKAKNYYVQITLTIFVVLLLSWFFIDGFYSKSIIMIVCSYIAYVFGRAIEK